MSNNSKFLVSIILTMGIGFLGSVFTMPEIQGWYLHLNKPVWNPPNWLFAPVWSALYLSMGIALFRVWKKDAESDRKQWAIIIFAAQLLLNFCWSFIFFKQHQLGWAFVELVVMWLAILLTIIGFSRIDKLAAWLLVPYISWVSFAGILNYTVWHLN
jgi:translocator protein